MWVHNWVLEVMLPVMEEMSSRFQKVTTLGEQNAGGHPVTEEGLWIRRFTIWEKKQNAGGHPVTEEGLQIKKIYKFNGGKTPEATWSQKKGFYVLFALMFLMTKNCNEHNTNWTTETCWQTVGRN